MQMQVKRAEDEWKQAKLRTDESLARVNLQSYWTTTKLRKLTVVLNYYEAMETYSRI